MSNNDETFDAKAVMAAGSALNGDGVDHNLDDIAEFMKSREKPNMTPEEIHNHAMLVLDTVDETRAKIAAGGGQIDGAIMFVHGKDSAMNHVSMAGEVEVIAQQLNEILIQSGSNPIFLLGPTAIQSLVRQIMPMLVGSMGMAMGVGMPGGAPPVFTPDTFFDED